ncbi:MAG TPA: hypothetical protein VIC54_11235 [Terriglobales bacterium]|jgi:protein ImuB
MSGFLAAWVPAFALQAAGGLGPHPAAAWERQGVLELVVSANPGARAAGVRTGMAVAEAQGRCPQLQLWRRDARGEQTLAARLWEEAGRISPRVQAVGPDLVVIDCTGVERLQGTAEAAGRRLAEAMAQGGWRVRLGTGAHATAALLAVKSGLGRIAPGQEQATLAALPVTYLRNGISKLPADEGTEEVLRVLEGWGVRTLGAFAALPAAEVAARMGAVGVRLHSAARGEAAERFEAAAEPGRVLECHEVLDPPINDGERMRAALERAVAGLRVELERQDRVVEHGTVRLQRDRGGVAEYERSFAVPTRDGRALVEQLLHVIEQQPPGGWIERLQLQLRLTRARRVQGHLFATAVVEKEKTARLLERLGAIWNGEGVGTAQRMDTYRSGAFEMRPFAPSDHEVARHFSEEREDAPRLSLRRFRPPKRWQAGMGEIVRRAGPWRSRGGWWRKAGEGWAEDEWDAEIRFPGRKQSGLYRLRHDLEGGGWYIAGQYD